MPQLDLSTFQSQLFWFIVIIQTLYWLLTKKYLQTNTKAKGVRQHMVQMAGTPSAINKELIEFQEKEDGARWEVSKTLNDIVRAKKELGETWNKSELKVLGKKALVDSYNELSMTLTGVRAAESLRLYDPQSW